MSIYIMYAFLVFVISEDPPLFLFHCLLYPGRQGAGRKGSGPWAGGWVSLLPFFFFFFFFGEGRRRQGYASAPVGGRREFTSMAPLFLFSAEGHPMGWLNVDGNKGK